MSLLVMYNFHTKLHFKVCTPVKRVLSKRDIGRHQQLPLYLTVHVRKCIIAEPKGKASNLAALLSPICMYVCISAACAMKYYARVCISRHACAMLAQQRGQNEPRGEDCELSGGRLAKASDDCKLFCALC